jgi:dipeptidyl-peptidase-3
VTTGFYKKLTKPPQKWIDEYRPLVFAKKLPRKIFVQPTTSVVDGDVVLREYPVTIEGVIESFVERAL